jgi:hypothetical protein
MATKRRRQDRSWFPRSAADLMKELETQALVDQESRGRGIVLAREIGARATTNEGADAWQTQPRITVRVLHAVYTRMRTAYTRKYPDRRKWPVEVERACWDFGGEPRVAGLLEVWRAMRGPLHPGTWDSKTMLRRRRAETPGRRPRRRAPRPSGGIEE